MSPKGKLVLCVDKVGGYTVTPAAVPIAIIQHTASGGAASQMWAAEECKAGGGWLLQLWILCSCCCLPDSRQVQNCEFYRAPVRVRGRA